MNQDPVKSLIITLVLAITITVGFIIGLHTPTTCSGDIVIQYNSKHINMTAPERCHIKFENVNITMEMVTEDIT